MKKVISLLLLLALVFSFAGCHIINSGKVNKEKEIEITYNTFSEWGGGEYQIVDGELYCRKENSLGLLGEDIFAYYDDWTKTNINANNIIHLEVYSGILLYLTNDGRVYVLGKAEEMAGWCNAENDTTKNITTPVLLFEDCKTASLGVRFALFLKNDNTLWFVGESYYGQSTVGTETISKPIKIAENILFAQAFVGTSAWIDSENNLYLCGNNSYGQIGNGTMGKGIPMLYRDAVEEPFCALTDCVAFSVEQVKNGITVVRAENSIGEKFVWGGAYGATPIYDDGRVKVDSHDIYDEYLPKEQEK